MSIGFSTDSVEVGFGISASPVISAEWGEIGGDIEEQDDLQAALGGKLSDAPKDGKSYGRKDGAWSEVTGGGGAAWGGITGTLGDQTDLQSALDAKGTYSKPVGGIPKADMASGVKGSLDLADSALQEHQSLAAYRTAAQQDAIHDATKQDALTTSQLAAADSGITAEDKTKLDGIAQGAPSSAASDAGKLLAVNAQGAPEWKNLGLQSDYELIEKIIVGYSITTSEPSDWSTNFRNYFTNTGTLREPVYMPVSGDTAPDWEIGVYYSFDSSGSSSISRKIEPDGSPYNFKKLFVKFKSLSTQQAGYNFVYIRNTNSSTCYMNLTLDSGENNYCYKAELDNLFIHHEGIKDRWVAGGSVLKLIYPIGNGFPVFIEFSMGIPTAIKNGTNIEIYGVRA